MQGEMSPSLGATEVLAHDSNGPKLEAIRQSLQSFRGNNGPRLRADAIIEPRGGVMCWKPIDENA